VIEQNSLFFVEKSSVLKKNAAHAEQPVFRDGIFVCGMFSDKFCSEVCGMTHLRIIQIKKTDYPDGAPAARHTCDGTVPSHPFRKYSKFFINK
jgi:hypothetical protein